MKLKGLVAATNFMNQFDRNKKGFVTFEDMASVLGDQWSQQELQDQQLKFREMDQDQDGKVNKNEFYKWFVKQEMRKASSPSRSRVRNDNNKTSKESVELNKLLNES